MRKIFNLALALIMVVSLFSFTGCKSEGEVIELNVYNWEDYICKDEDNDLIADFEAFASEKYGKKVVVNYSTFGTNENMYNELQLSKVKTENGYDYGYDLVCPSDYMIQKMLGEGMLEKFDRSLGNLDNYDTYSSKYILDLFEKYGWTDYACGYMYGTMGFVYNPEVLERNSGGEYQPGDEAHWDFPWKTYSKNLGTIKDSIRDTYALAIGKVYSEELKALSLRWKAGELSDEDYQEQVVGIFNRTDEATVQKVTEELIELKGNVYGFEVDSGKRDMASGKIAINFAWSGDAVYTLDIADEANTELFYAVPEEGSNIWFDGWVMPKGANIELSQDFVNFLADPENAQINMNYIGYTPVVAGSEMHEFAISWYGAYTLIETDDAQHADFVDSKTGKAYFEYYVQDAIDEGELVLGEDYLDNGIDAETGYRCITVNEMRYPVYDEKEENIIRFEYYEDVDLYLYDVSFLLNTESDDGDMFIWTDTLGRQLETQYPTRETVMRCAIMKHFNDVEMARLNDMWDEVKVSAIPSWLMIMIVGIILLAIIVAPILSYLNKKGIHLNLKFKRKNLTLIKREPIK
ncbi:MAG: extracellular solute-binding protein [Clostridia bacterium]|nr:extracellular solute-binding protein [Clostridia bacterium]